MLLFFLFFFSFITTIRFHHPLSLSISVPGACFVNIDFVLKRHAKNECSYFHFNLLTHYVSHLFDLARLHLDNYQFATMIDSKGLSEQMYKVFSSFWSTTKVPTPLALDDVDDGDWVMINRSKDENDRTRPTIENENPLENSWISSPPLIKSDEAIPLARLNPIENLLIEHASEYA